MLPKKNNLHPSFIPYSELSDEAKQKLDKELQLLDAKYGGFELHPLLALVFILGTWAILYYIFS